MGSDPYRPNPRIHPRAPLEDRLPRVLAWVHNYPPAQNSGAEWMLHELLVGARHRGLDVRVCAARVNHDWEFEGVRVYGRPTDDRKAALVGWSDVLVTHLDLTREAVTLARRGHRPVAHLIHNDRQLEYHRVQPDEIDALMVNSEWIADHYRPWGAPMVIVRPAVDPDRYRTSPGQRVTLVNMNPAKGGPLFWRLARKLPHRRFLAVRGGYGDQVGFPAVRSRDDVARSPKNVAFQWPTANMRDDVYARTRVLLVPSSYESYGRVAVEALASGIPVVAHPTPGLRESLGEAGLFVDRDDDAGWCRVIERLHDVGYWRERSAIARERSSVLRPERELDAFADTLHALAHGRPITPVSVVGYSGG